MMLKKQDFPEQKIIDNIKALGLDMINQAQSGHPGIVLGAAPLLYTLYAKHMVIHPGDPKWLNRDRFIMSAGHGSALIYALLLMAGYNITINDLKQFRQLNSKTPGHPEYGVTPGIDFTTGPLGQGLASAVGIAMAECFLATKYNIKKKSVLDAPKNLFDYYTYVLCSDGDIMEGVSYEAASLAGTLKLNKLIVLYDSNNVTLDGKLTKVFTENIPARFAALGWNVQVVTNGESVNEIDRALNNAKKSNKPTLIQVKTVIGQGSRLSGTNKVHGTPLKKEDLENIKANLGIRDVPFAVSKEAVEELRKLIMERNQKRYENWTKLIGDYVAEATPKVQAEIKELLKGNAPLNIDLPKLMWQFPADLKEPMRDTNAKIMNVIADNAFNFIGGNADVASSTRINLLNCHNYCTDCYDGCNIAFGVREHAMGAILNGLAVSGFKPFGSTFLVFADYLKPAIRLSALMQLPVTYIFTHDSINIGADGPTHQPIEQLAMLRSIPDFAVYRPADAREIVGVWDIILKNNQPAALIINRNETPLLVDTKMEGVKRGAYIVRQEQTRLAGILIATGSEVNTALQVANELLKKGLDVRVVSVPCIELFLKQPESYQNTLFPTGYKTVVIEMGSSFGWFRFVYNQKYLMTLDCFGKSGTTEQVLKNYGFDVATLTLKIEELLR